MDKKRALLGVEIYPLALRPQILRKSMLISTRAWLLLLGGWFFGGWVFGDSLTFGVILLPFKLQ
jgi:hypothetical protein